MPNFYLLKRSVKPDDIFVRRYEDPRDYGDRCYAGQPMSMHGGEAAALFYEGGRKTDYVAGIFSFPVVSSRFKALILEFESGHVEFEELGLICTVTGDSDRAYSFLNLRDLVSCLDWDRSRVQALEEVPHVPHRVEQLVIDEAQTSGSHMFWMAELRSVILVSEEFRRQIERSRLTGIEFHDIAEYRKP